MANLIPWLKFAGARIPATGLPVATGTIRLYVRDSTSEEIDTFADAEETTPLTQPIALNAAGQAEVYANEDADIVIYDSLGAEKLRATAANGINALQVEVVSAIFNGGARTEVKTVLETMAESLGADGEYQESDSAEVVSRTYHDVCHDKISPYDFGAVGDGTADDTQPLQLAINRAASAKLPLFLGDGTFKITAGLTSSAQIMIYGSGIGLSKITSADDTITALTLSAGGSLRDFSVELPYPATDDNTCISCSGYAAYVARVYVKGNIGVSIGSGTVESCTADVYGNGSNPAVGFKAGNGGSIIGCKVNANPESGTVQNSFGVQLTSYGTSSHSCYVTGANIGFAAFAAGCVHYNGAAYGCNYGFNFTNSYTGAVSCYASASATSDAAYTSPATSKYINYGNSWLFQQPAIITKQTSSASSPTFTFDSTAEVNLLRCSGSAGSGTFTLNWPSPAPTLIPGTRYKIVIQTASSIALNTVTIDSHFHSVSAPTSLTAGVSYSCWYMVPTSADSLCQDGSWQTVGTDLWT